MAISTKIEDGSGEGLQAHVHEKDSHNGLIVFTDRLAQEVPITKVFTASGIGSDLNQNVSFSGTPEGIHDGEDSTLWTASALSGIWTFDSTTNPNSGSQCIDATATVNGSQALFSDVTTTDMANFVALTCFVRLENFVLGHQVQIQFRLAGVSIGNVVNIYDFIDISVLNSYQKVVVPKADFGITTQTVDEITIQSIKTSGANPDFRLDDIQLENIGNIISFTVEADKGTLYKATHLRLTIADNIAGTLLNGTMPALSYNKIMDISVLTSGIIIQTKINDTFIETIIIRQLSDLLLNGFNLVNQISDGTNTLIILEREYPEPVILKSVDLDSIVIQINDDLSSLLLFRACVRGKKEEIVTIR